jgi:hypothetical protein
MMKKLLKIPLGVASLAAGGALLLSNGAALADSLLVTRSGVSLGNLFFFAVGLCGLGAACDCLGPPRKPAEKKQTIAASIWSTRAHVDQWDIGEN